MPKLWLDNEKKATLRMVKKHLYKLFKPKMFLKMKMKN